MADAYQLELVTATGQRKYLNLDERRALLQQANQADTETRAFLRVLLYTGARVTEALAINEASFITEGGNPSIRLRTLKKKRGAKPSYRQVPIPDWLYQSLRDSYRFGEDRDAAGRKRDPLQPLWSWSRQTAWKRVKHHILEAGIDAELAHPKAVRHSMGIAAVLADPPVHISQLAAWFGHSSESTTSAYYKLVSTEAKLMARPMWDDLERLR